MIIALAGPFKFKDFLVSPMVDDMGWLDIGIRDINTSSVYGFTARRKGSDNGMILIVFAGAIAYTNVIAVNW